MKFLMVFFLAIYLVSCGSEEEPKRINVKSKKEYDELMIASHKAFLKKEQEKIQNFKKKSSAVFKSSTTGLQYAIISSGGNDSLKIGDIAVVDYTLLLLNGDTAYSTAGKPQEFMVELDDVEKGLHEGIQKMAVNDSAIFILPAHLAHGITGDQAAIPTQSTVVYFLKLLAKK